nr:MAG TPA: sialoprotein [Caudoviricetes sp.]
MVFLTQNIEFAYILCLFISVYFVLSLYILYRHKILFLYPPQKREVC